MNEEIIESLIKLYAIITDYPNLTSRENSALMVESYLKENFTKDMVDKYLELYQKNLDYYYIKHREILFKDKTEEKNVNYIYLFNICDNIVENFDLNVRFLIVVQLLNFINKAEGHSQADLKIVYVIARILKIDEEEYDNLMNFYLFSLDKVKNKNCLFVVNGDETFHDPEINHLRREGQATQVYIIRIESINTLFFYYWGPRNLYLNGHHLLQRRLYVFPPGGILRTSRIIPIYYSSIMSRFIQEKGKPRIVLNVEEVEYHFNKKIVGIHPLSFQERSGDLVGIIGGSGVGKTTLLNVLNGKLKPSKGTITINGFDIHDEKNSEHLKGVIGYVPQDDLLLEELTVYKNLEFNARFCFGNMNEEEIQEIIEQTLVDFDLVEARDLVVGNPLKKILSGGQRKRLNIALELMREPSILFVDEPTSGLSSADSEKVMFLLKKQCLKGRLVIVNIHQPDSNIYKLFDRILIMDKGGRMAFFGNPMEAITYFKQEANYINPDESECMTCGNIQTVQPLRIIEERMVDAFGHSIRKRKITPEEWYQRYQEKVEPRVIDFMKQNPVQEEKLPDVLFKTPRWFKQLKLFIQRDFETKRSNKQYLTIALLESPLLAIILSFFSKYTPEKVYKFALNDNIPSFLFMSVVVALFVGLIISAEEIFKDQKILKREEFLELSRGAYFTSKILILFIISAIQTISFILIGHYMLEIRGVTLSTWAILFTTACFANVLGLNLSAGLKSAVSIYILIPLLLVPQLLLSGVIVDFNKMHPSLSSYTRTPIVGDVMTSRWSYEALAVNLFKNNNFEQNVFELEKNKNDLNFKTFYLIPELSRNLVQYGNELKTGNKEDAQIRAKLLYNEFSELSAEAKKPGDSVVVAMKALKDDQFQPVMATVLDTYLNSCKSVYLNRYNQATKTLDNQFSQLLSQFGGNSDLLVAYKEKYFNKKLEDLVREKYETYKIHYADNRIYQGDEPIFRPVAYHNGTAQFYASYKQIGPIKIDTVLFDLIVIWIFTFFLMVSLYFDWLRKLLSYIESWRLAQQTILLDKIFYNPMSFTKGRKE
ncbi:MAG TPA: ATP-binding cassette domain-containing protein [Prolixibacteraceae bacterium]|nr:ATP-binding cassette domain-containing protein [Prolixibacteraceae bacterium]HPS13475.1 ATP-binding cassette domain-containing protein [Prolixibacteraceae bacterium]